MRLVEAGTDDAAKELHLQWWKTIQPDKYGGIPGQVGKLMSSIVDDILEAEFGAAK